ncbi:NAD(P)-binding protein [Phaeosphaeriaceae sp. SRC1lsM3a]|nr:NAD(P)-binding protein [Stagonospora sp. SRC1lsM3a]
MVTNILVTGAAGYIVRSDEQLDALQKTSIKAIRLDLSDEASVIAAVRDHNINIVIHAASSINPALAKPLITALAQHQTTSKIQTHFIHTSALSAFFPNTGWPEKESNDSDAIFETEKSLKDSFPVRTTDVEVVEHSKLLGVKSYIVIPSTVYGKGTGAWNQLSVVLPIFVSAALAQKQVYKFPENIKIAAIHISDLTSLYERIVAGILVENEPESGEKGYYFGIAHDLHWHEVAARFAVTMKARHLVTDTETGTWATGEDAAEALGVPRMFVQVLWNSGSNMVAHNEARLGWKPQWLQDDFYAHLDEEILSVVDLGKAKSSLIESLRQAAPRR